MQRAEHAHQKGYEVRGTERCIKMSHMLRKVPMRAPKDCRAVSAFYPEVQYHAFSVEG